jgi:hypothetical protein
LFDETSFPKTELGQKIFDDMLVTLGDKHPSYCKVKSWVARFRTEYLSTEDEECCGINSTDNSRKCECNHFHKYILKI